MIDDLLIDAITLKSNNNMQRKALDDYIHDIITGINSSLKNARSNGESGIIIEIPIIFAISGMNNKDAQRIIWSSVIEILKKKNYNVLINHNKSSCRLKITMLDTEDTKKIQYQLDILKSNAGQF
jgi:hypothetical protein